MKSSIPCSRSLELIVAVREPPCSIAWRLASLGGSEAETAVGHPAAEWAIDDLLPFRQAVEQRVNLGAGRQPVAR